jgi:ABC-2 type transport system ATP-binding protein
LAETPGGRLGKTFGDVRAVDGVSFEVRAGEIFAFLGPNGAGKTTTIQMLTTLLRPTSGAIALDGLDPATRPLDARPRFGLVKTFGDVRAVDGVFCRAVSNSH